MNVLRKSCMAVLLFLSSVGPALSADYDRFYWGQSRAHVKSVLGKDNSIPLLQGDRLVYDSIMYGYPVEITYGFASDCLWCSDRLVVVLIKYFDKTLVAEAVTGLVCNQFKSLLIQENGFPHYTGKDNNYFSWSGEVTEVLLSCSYGQPTITYRSLRVR